MKRKLIALAVGICTLAALTACGNSDDESNETQGSITLGQYKDIEVQKSVATITDDELKDYIDYILDSNKTTENVEEGTTKADDKILAIYTATMDGEKVSDLSSASTGATVTLSKDGFTINGFVDKLIGQTVGKTVEFDITIQDDFSNKDYAGKTVHYAVEIKNLVVTTVPELTDEWVKETYGYLKLATVDEFKTYFKENLFVNTVYNDIIEGILENQTVESYNSTELAEMTDMYKTAMENQLSSYGIELDAYLQAMSKSSDEFAKEMEEQAKAYLKQKMFIYKVAENENITLTDEEYAEKMLEYAHESGFESAEELESYYDGVMDSEDFRYSMIGDKVQKFLCDNIKIVEDKEEETTTKEEETTTKAAE